MILQIVAVRPNNCGALAMNQEPWIMSMGTRFSCLSRLRHCSQYYSRLKEGKEVQLERKYTARTATTLWETGAEITGVNLSVKSTADYLLC